MVGDGVVGVNVMAKGSPLPATGEPESSPVNVCKSLYTFCIQVTIFSTFTSPWFSPPLKMILSSAVTSIFFTSLNPWSERKSKEQATETLEGNEGELPANGGLFANIKGGEELLKKLKGEETEG